MAKICIGIPAYSTVSAETLEDYMRFAYFCGKRSQHDFFLAIKSKTEQFRARNAIVEAALQADCQYLLMMDDDHIIDWERVQFPHIRYGFIDRFVEFLEQDEKAGIIGALYYQRGGDCRPVVMYHGTDGGFYWMRLDQIENGIQEVGVTGGGCMLIKMEVFNKIDSPWFRPELDLGTDIQVCKAAREHGFKVFCDTSTVIGHVMARHDIVTPKNRTQIAIMNQNMDITKEGMEISYLVDSAMALFREDVKTYMNMEIDDIIDIGMKYKRKNILNFYDFADKKEYYAQMGNEQLARQLYFHHQDNPLKQMEYFYKNIKTNMPGHGIDYGCGSAPVTFDLAMRGHKMDFIDIDGAGAYEFLKWRVKHRCLEDRCSFQMNGSRYDYAFFLDSIEHFENWEEILETVIDKLKDGGAIFTNYFKNVDFSNPEHISMDHNAVKKFLIERGIYPMSEMVWRKNIKFKDIYKEVLPCQS